MKWAFFEGGASLLPSILEGRGHRPPTTFGVRKLGWLPFRMVSKYPQWIIWFCRNTCVWQTDRQTDGRRELQQQYCVLHYMQPHGKIWVEPLHRVLYKCPVTLLCCKHHHMATGNKYVTCIIPECVLIRKFKVVMSKKQTAQNCVQNCRFWHGAVHGPFCVGSVYRAVVNSSHVKLLTDESVLMTAGAVCTDTTAAAAAVRCRHV